ncbi:hypothetical protein ANOM_007599, partial [Aspergillus nomiae NRRL 13137]
LIKAVKLSDQVSQRDGQCVITAQVNVQARVSGWNLLGNRTSLPTCSGKYIPKPRIRVFLEAFLLKPWIDYTDIQYDHSTRTAEKHLGRILVGAGVIQGGIAAANNLTAKQFLDMLQILFSAVGGFETRRYRSRVP